MASVWMHVRSAARAIVAAAWLLVRSAARAIVAAAWLRVRSAARAVAVAGLLLPACKDKPAPSAVQPAPAAPTPAPPTSTAPALPPSPGAPHAPALPGDSQPHAAQPITAEEAVAAMPKLAGDVMIAPKAMADGSQVHGTWCLPGSAADAVVHDLAATLTAGGWTGVSTRGDATKAGLSAERDGMSLSYVVSASSAATCRAPGHYFTSATIFRTR